MRGSGVGKRQRANWAGRLAFLLGTAILGTTWLPAQVFIVQREHVPGVPDFKPTAVELEQQPISVRTRQELIIAFAAEQGFARRPLPLGSHGLVLHANGPLSPSGSGYVDALQKNGISSKSGDRVAISNFKIESDRIIFEFNGGPDKKHKYLQHLSVGMNSAYTPLAQDTGETPVGSRLTLVFDKHVPEITPDQLRALIQPVIDFNVKTPVEAYTDTLPPKLKNAILNHQVLVGMDRKMVIYAVGQPHQKVREQDSNGMFEEWIYGEAPKPTQFVRFSNNRVTRLEIAEVGKTPVIRDRDETDGYLGNPVTRDVYMGDARANPNGESSPGKAPSLRLPGEAAPPGPMQPVQMPKDHVQPPPLPPAGQGTGSSLMASAAGVR